MSENETTGVSETEATAVVEPATTSDAPETVEVTLTENGTTETLDIPLETPAQIAAAKLAAMKAAIVAKTAKPAPAPVDAQADAADVERSAPTETAGHTAVVSERIPVPASNTDVDAALRKVIAHNAPFEMNSLQREYFGIK